MKAAILALAATLCAVSPALADAAPAAPVQNNSLRVVVPDRNIVRGDVIAAADLSYQTVSGGILFSGIATAKAQLVGKQARRYLRVGQPVRTEDVRAPILVTKGSTVTMIFKAPGIQLTAVGRAMSQGGMGETVTVLNPVSYRQITATVTGPGTVTAGGSTATISEDPASAQLAAAQN